MRRFTLALAKVVYRATPLRSVRNVYLKLFLTLVRRRKTVAPVDGMTFDLDLGEMIDVCVYLGEYEGDVVTAIERVCQPGWRVLDIGANIGAHTLRFAKLVGEAGNVYAFEPTDYAYRKLMRNVSLNAYRNVVPVQVALSDQNLKEQPVSFRASWRTDARRVDGVSVVDFRRLDDWCAERQVDRVDLIKLDVDGNEFAVLNGAPRLLRRCRPVMIMEATAYHFREPSTNPLVLLSRLGYEFFDPKTDAPYGDVESVYRRCQGVDSVNIVGRTATS